MLEATRPTVFIGSSSQGLEIARAVSYQLKDVAFATVWNEGNFHLGQGTLAELVGMLDRFDFAILILTPDDAVVIHDREMQAPRDNVLLELGLFMGRLGSARTFAVCSDAPNLRLPSDLSGVTVARFSAMDAAKNLAATVGPACFEIRQAILSQLKETVDDNHLRAIEGVYYAGEDGRVNKNYAVTFQHVGNGAYLLRNPDWSGMGTFDGSRYRGLFVYGSDPYHPELENMWGVHSAVFNASAKRFDLQFRYLSEPDSHWEVGHWTRAATKD